MSVKHARVEPVGAEGSEDVAAAVMPPGPPLPAWAQTLAFMCAARRFLAACERRYGGAVTLSTLFDRRFVMIFDPGLVKELFQGPHEQVNAGEANALLGPLLGERSVLVLDGASICDIASSCCRRSTANACVDMRP